MYNEDRKELFISKKESEVIVYPNFLRNTFDKTSKFEEKYGKDVCEWGLSEIISFYKYNNLYSIFSLATLNSTLRMYCDWCISQMLVPDGQNHFSEVNNDILGTCINRKHINESIISRDELLDKLSLLYNDQDRFILLALFEGIKGKYALEICNAKLTDIQGDKMQLCTGRTVAVSKELARYARLAEEETDYTHYMTGEKCSKLVESSDHTIFKVLDRNRKRDMDLDRIFITRFQNSMEYMGFSNKCTPNKLMISGKIHFIKQIMENDGLSLEQTLQQRRLEINNQYTNDRIVSSSSFMIRYGEYFK